MPMARAVRLCQDLIILPSDFSAYHEKSVQVMRILGQLTPLVEQISIDEAFLDVSDMPDDGLSIARKLQQDILRELRLPCSLGVASNKLVAKIATNVGKSAHRGNQPPQAIRYVPPGTEAQFLAPLPVRELWGIGPKTAGRLNDLGVKTIGELAEKSDGYMRDVFGRNGPEMGQRARGIDHRPLSTESEMKSISQELTFADDEGDWRILEKTLLSQSSEIARALRRKGVQARTIRIKLRWPDFSTHTRQRSFSQPTDQDRVIFQTACHLLNMMWKPGKRVRLLGVGASSLSRVPDQLLLWDTSDQRERRLHDALDELRERFGDKAVYRGDELDPD